MQNLLPSALLAVFIFVFRGDTDAAYLGAQFVFSGVIFALFYFLGRIMFRSRVWSWFFSLTAVLSPMALKLPFYKWRGLAEFQAFFVNNFIPFVRTQFDQLYLARVDEPLLTYPVYLSAIISFFVFWSRPSRRSAVASGFFAGLLFYTYFHHWVYWLTVVLFLFLFVLALADKRRIKAYLFLFLALAVTSLPYFWQYFEFRSLASQHDFVLRAGVAFGRVVGLTRENVADYLVYSALALAIYLFYRGRDREKLVLLEGLIAAMFLVWNVQLAVGYAPVPHFFRRSISPVIFIVVFALLHDLIGRLAIKRPQIERCFLLALVVLSLFVVTKKVVNAASLNYFLQRHIYDYYEFPSAVADSWGWLEHNLPRESVMVSPSTLTSFYLNSHTSARPFLPTAYITLLDVPEMEARYLKSHRLFGVEAEFLERRLVGQVNPQCDSYDCPPDRDSNLNDSLGNLLGNYFASRYGSFKGFESRSGQDLVYPKRAEKIAEMVKNYRQVEPDWGQLGGSYVYQGPLENEISSVDFAGRNDLGLVYQNPQVKIYKILPQGPSR